MALWTAQVSSPTRSARSPGANLWVGTDIPALATPPPITVPTVTDQLAEPAESLRLALTYDNAEPLPGRPVLDGDGGG